MRSACRGGGVLRYGGKKANMMITCFSVTRQAAYRAMNLCAMTSKSVLWDNLELTNSSYGAAHVLKDGHHYRAAVNRMMLRVMVSHVLQGSDDSLEGVGEVPLGCDVVPRVPHHDACQTLRWGRPVVWQHGKTQIRVPKWKRVSRKRKNETSAPRRRRSTVPLATTMM